ncbi:hypothetical protein P7K49_025402 [Saguinus oedipus]|uniref:Uncharacterized protein n=1 Tax=Saguinus oedipus TaxID=9490 RepID=A0ABQ9UIG0_SAGOE|nr:hypothetical protein P7K49_025402 [Saguinus oedipus]
MGVDLGHHLFREAPAHCGALWEGRTAPGWHCSDLLLPGSGRRGGVQEASSAKQASPASGTNPPLVVPGGRTRPLHAPRPTPALTPPLAAGFPTGTRREAGARRPRASLEGEGLPEGLAAAAAAGGGASGAGSPSHTVIPAGMEADLSQLSEEERRQIAAVMEASPRPLRTF